MKYRIKIFFLLVFLSCSKEDIAKDIKVQSIVINGDNVLSTSIKQLSVNILPNNVTNKEVSWNVSDPTIAMITETGLLTGIKNGTVNTQKRREPSKTVKHLTNSFV